MARIAHLLIALLLLNSAAAASRALTPAEKDCAFKQTVVFGASISAQTAMSLPLYHTMVSAMALSRGVTGLPPFGPSPVNLFMSQYSGQGWFGYGLDISKMFTQKDADLGSSQARELMYGTHREAFKKATVAFGIDAFYWDAIGDTCAYSGGGGVEQTIEDLIREARAARVNLVLGTVPHEDSSKVLIDSETLGIPGLWYKPDDMCTDSINRKLFEKCHATEGCYLIDINAMAATLYTGGKLKLVSGRSYGLYQIRPDGVHVSTLGAQYLNERIIEAFESAPPVCR